MQLLVMYIRTHHAVCNKHLQGMHCLITNNNLHGCRMLGMCEVQVVKMYHSAMAPIASRLSQAYACPGCIG